MNPTLPPDAPAPEGRVVWLDGAIVVEAEPDFAPRRLAIDETKWVVTPANEEA